MDKEFAYRDGAHFQKGAGVPPQIVGEHLEMLRGKSGGVITPALVVDDARNPNSPLHRFFEWDDSAAAEQYRLQQARGVIQAVVVRYRETDNAPAKTIRAFVSVKTDEGPRYAGIVEVMNDQQQRAALIRKAWNELQGFRKKYADLTEFGQLFASIDELKAGLPPMVNAA